LSYIALALAGFVIYTFIVDPWCWSTIFCWAERYILLLGWEYSQNAHENTHTCYNENETKCP